MSDNERRPNFILRLFLAIAATAMLSVAHSTPPSELPDLDLWDHGIVFDAAVDSHGRLYIAGRFSHADGIPRGNIARYTTDGTLDSSFSVTTNDAVYALKMMPDDSIILGGLFTRVNGVTRNHIAKLESTGELVSSWNPDADAFVFETLPDDNGNLYIAGGFTIISGQARSRLAKLDLETGALDSDWTPSADNFVLSLDFDAEGKIWVGGDFDAINGQAASKAARISLGGALDLAMNFDDRVSEILVNDADQVYFCGDFTSIGTETRPFLARIDDKGQLESWSPTPDLGVVDCTLDSNSLLIAGRFNEVNGIERIGVARILQDGSLDQSFSASARGVFTGTLGSESENWLIERIDGNQIAIGGWLRYLNDAPRSGLAIVDDLTGSPNAPRNVEQPAEIRKAMVPLSDGGYLIGGSFRRAGAHLRDNLLRLNPDMTLALDWVMPVNGSITSAAIDEAGRVYFGGFFTSFGDQSGNNLFRIDDPSSPVANGTWTPMPNGPILSIYPNPENPETIYIGGQFDNITIGEVAFPRGNAARLSLLGGGEPDAFNPEFNSQVNTIMQPSGSSYLLIGGVFTDAGGFTRRGIAAIDSGANGTVLPTFDAQTNGVVWSIVGSSDGEHIYIGGQFSSFGGEARNRLAKIGPGADTWNPGSNGSVVGLELDEANQQLYVSGTFTQLGGQARGRLGRVSSQGAGELDAKFGPNISPNLVWSTVLNGSSLIIGGNFTSVSSMPRRAIAKFLLAPSEPVDLIYKDRFAEFSKWRTNQQPNTQKCQQREPFQKPVISPSPKTLGIRPALDDCP